MDIRLHRAKLNTIITLAYQLITTVCGVVIPWIMIDRFGSAAYGATTSIAQFLSYISLFEGGMGRVARGALYGPLAEGDNDKISSVYYAVKRFFTFLGIAFAGYAVIIAIFYYDFADVSFFKREYTFMLVISISIGKFAEYMGGISNITLFNADQRQYVVNSVYIVTNIINVISIIILATSGADILSVKLCSSLVFVLRPILFTCYLKKHYAIRKPKERSVLENKVTGIAQHFAYVVQNNTDVLLLTLFADLKIVAVYSVYQLVVSSIRNIVMSFTSGMEAMFGNAIAKNEKETLIEFYETYKFILTIVTFTLFTTTAITIVPFVKLYTAGVSDVNYIAPAFAMLIVFAEAINCLVLPCFNLSISANKLKESRMGAYGEAATNLSISLFLVFVNPLIGVAIGTLISAIFKFVFYSVFSCKNILQINIRKVLTKTVVTVAAMLVASLLGFSIVNKIDVSNYGIWIILGVVTVIISGVISLILGLVLYPGKIKYVKQIILKKAN